MREGELRVTLHKSTSYLTHCYYAAVYSEVISHFKVWFQRSREKRSCISLTLCYHRLLWGRQSVVAGKELITIKTFMVKIDLEILVFEPTRSSSDFSIRIYLRWNRLDPFLLYGYQLCHIKYFRTEYLIFLTRSATHQYQT